MNQSLLLFVDGVSFMISVSGEKMVDEKKVGQIDMENFLNEIGKMYINLLKGKSVLIIAITEKNENEYDSIFKFGGDKVHITRLLAEALSVMPNEERISIMEMFSNTPYLLGKVEAYSSIVSLEKDKLLEWHGKNKDYQNKKMSFSSLKKGDKNP